jgi:hypothetical protein
MTSNDTFDNDIGRYPRLLFCEVHISIWIFVFHAKMSSSKSERMIISGMDIN